MGSSLHHDPIDLPVVITRTQALAAGFSSGQINHRIRSELWSSPRRGIYVRDCARVRTGDRFAHERQDHIIASIAAALTHELSVVAYGSAAMVHDLPLISGTPTVPHLVVPADRWSGKRSDIALHRAKLDDHDVVNHYGVDVPVTTPARTWVDVARTATPADALSVGDAVLRSHATTTGDLGRALDQQVGRPGWRLAAEALTHVDARRETALESLSWCRFIDWNLPLPELQREFHDARGFIGRVDFFWEEWGVIGEADGRLKYATSDDVFAEKRREDRLRALGFRVVRWTWREVWQFESQLRYQLSQLLLPAA